MTLTSHEVADEAILLAGGAAAILLQIANPAVGHGVAAHSDFAGRPLDRLTGTLTYLYVTLYGTPEEAARVARHVGRAHRPVHSGSGDAVVYDARNVDLQIWVASTIYSVGVQVYELVFGRLSAADAESLYQGYTVVATALGVPRERMPADRAAFARYWADAEPELRVDDTSRAVARQLLHPTAGPWWLKVVMPPMRVVTAGLLAPDLRAAYGLDLDRRRFDRMVRVARAVYPRLPGVVRRAPRIVVLRRFRRAA